MTEDRNGLPVLPVSDPGPPERGDAARNRARVLEAASRLFDEQGVEAVTMDAVACAAGVGKGTLFRRFGDRAGLCLALLDGRGADHGRLFANHHEYTAAAIPAR